MISFKEFIAEATDPVTEKKQAAIAKLQSQDVDGWHFNVTFHAGSQCYERTDKILPFHWTKMLKAVSKYIENNVFKHGSFLFYSKAFRQGAVYEVIPNKKQANIVTVLPPRAQEVRGNTPTDFVMTEDTNVALIPQFVEID